MHIHYPLRSWRAGLVTAASTVLFMVALVGPAPVAATSGTWLFNPATGHYYSQVNGLTWADSEAYAVARGGHLVTINDQAEQDWLATNFPQANLWIGFNDRATEGTWVWTSGQSPTYTNWYPGEPNDGTGYGFGSEDTAVMNWENNQWNDLNENWFADYDPSGMAGIIEVARLPQAGTVGVYSLNDVSASPGVQAIYMYVNKYDAWKLKKIVVRAPNVSAVSGKTAQAVGWKFTVERRFCDFGHCGKWYKDYTSATFKAVTSDVANAPFSDESVGVRAGQFGYDGGYDYRVIVKMFWYRPSGSVQGSATVRDYYYLLTTGTTTEVVSKDCPAFH